jgi:hypothetical protein
LELSLKGLTRIFIDQTDQGQATTTAGLFDRLRAGSSTAMLTKHVSNFAQDDRGGGGHWREQGQGQERKQIPPLRCGMTTEWARRKNCGDEIF